MAGRRVERVGAITGDYAISVERTDMPAPPGWVWVKLTDVARLESGHTPSRRHPEYWDGDVPWIGIKDARDHHGRVIHETRERTNELGLANSAARLLPTSTVCLSRTASIGYALVLGRPMATSQDFVNWICSEALLPTFLQKLFETERPALLRFGKGSVHKTIYFPEVEQLRVCIPPPGEQRRIVDKIDALFAHSKNAKASLDRIPALLDKLKRSILAAAFRGDLTKDWREAHPEVEPAEALLARIRAERRRRWEEAELARLTARGKVPGDERWKEGYEEPAEIAGPATLPPTWTWTSVETLCEGDRKISYGVLKPGEHCDGGVRLVKSGQVRDGYLDLSEDYRISPSLADEFWRTELSGGEVLLNLVGASIGRTAIAPLALRGANVSRAIAVIPSLGPYSTWIQRALQGPQGQRLVAASVGGSAQPVLNLADVRTLPIPLPPAAEAHEVIRRIEALLALYAPMYERHTAVQKRFVALNASILSQAFRGKLVPQDPTDEPASALLDRIRAARESTTPAPDAPKRPRARRAAPAATPSAAAPAETPPPAPAPAPPTGPTTPFLELPRAAQLPLIHTALRGLGPVPGDAAVRLVADHLREHGRAEFNRLRSDGPLYAAIDKAIDAAVRAELVDRPQRGHVRAIVPDAKDYTDADWRRCLEGALAERAEAEAAAPDDDDALLHAAADWAVANMGLVHQRLRAGGLVHQGLSRALAAAAADTTGD